MKKHVEIYGELISKFNHRQYMFTVDELIGDLGNCYKNDIEKVIDVLLKAHIIQSVQPRVYEFRCDYQQLRRYLTAMDRPTAVKTKIEVEVVSKAELINTDWTLDMNVKEDLNEFDESEDEDEDEDEDDDHDHEHDKDSLDALRKEIERHPRKNDDISDYYSAKAVVTKYMAERSDSGDGSIVSFMNVAYPSGVPFTIGLHCDDAKLKLFFTDRADTYQYILSLMDASDMLSQNMAQVLLEKLEDEFSLKYIDRMLCIPLSLNDLDADALDSIAMLLMQRINRFLSKKVSWLTRIKTSSNEELEANVAAFIDKTLPHSYSYSDEAMFDKVVLAFIDRILLIDYRLSRQRAIEVAQTLKARWINSNASKTTLTVISRVCRELELCSDKEYARLKAQLYTKE